MSSPQDSFSGSAPMRPVSGLMDPSYHPSPPKKAFNIPGLTMTSGQPQQRALPQTTVLNGKAMVMDGSGNWVDQTSAAGKAMYGNSGNTGGTSVPGSPIINNAQKDPQVQLMAQNMNDRYKKLAGNEGKMDPYLQESINNLRQRQSSDTTQRAIDRANSGAADQAAGAMSTMAGTAARSGRGPGFGAEETQGAAQRLGAKQAADISLGRERDLDQLAIQGQSILRSPSDLATQQSGQTSNFLLGAGGMANQGANLALAQQGLGLEQYKAGTDANYKQALLNQGGNQDMFNNYLKLMQLGMGA